MNSLILKLYSMVLGIFFNNYYPYNFAGGKIYLNISESPMMLLRVLRLYEKEKMNAIYKFLKPGMTFIDVGANKGDFSLIAAKIVGDKGRVLSFEPEPNNFNWLKKSKELNKYKNINQFEMALANTNGNTQFYLSEKSGWHTLIPSLPNRSVRTININKRTLDSIIEKSDQKIVNMMKIDVEGAELEVIQGARQTLVRNPNIILLIDIHPQLGVKPVEVCNILSELGFSIYSMKEPYNTLAKVDNNLKEILAKK